MKKVLNPTTLLLCGVLLGLATGCIGLQIGGGEKHATSNATVGQQLIDLKTAKDTGAISESEYQAQKSKLLGNK